MVLHLMILVSTIPLLDSSDHYLVLSVSFVLVVLPLVALGVMELLVYRESIKKITRCIRAKPVITSDINEVPLNSIVVGDNMRKNATIVDM